VLVVAVVSGVLVLALGARPSGDAPVPVGVPQAYAGTTYAFDGVVCVGSQVAASTITGYQVEQADGSRTAFVRPPRGPITLGFPVDPDAGSSVDGYDVPAGEQGCTLRLLVTPEREGAVEAGTLRVRLRYGPFGLLRKTVSVTPDVTLQVVGSGADPRSTDASG